MCFAGRDPVTREAWPDEWIPVKWLKPDLRREARAIDSAAAARAAEQAGSRICGVRRSWAGLGWEGADEGLPRRGRSRLARAHGGGPGTAVTAVWMGGPLRDAANVHAQLVAERVPVACARPLTQRELEEHGAGRWESVVEAQPIALATPMAWATPIAPAGAGTGADAVGEAELPLGC